MENKPPDLSHDVQKILLRDKAGSQNRTDVNAGHDSIWLETRRRKKSKVGLGKLRDETLLQTDTIKWLFASPSEAGR